MTHQRLLTAAAQLRLPPRSPQKPSECGRIETLNTGRRLSYHVLNRLDILAVLVSTPFVQLMLFVAETAILLLDVVVAVCREP